MKKSQEPSNPFQKFDVEDVAMNQHNNTNVIPHIKSKGTIQHHTIPLNFKMLPYKSAFHFLLIFDKRNYITPDYKTI